jgi:DNA modification methylase
MIEYNKIYQEPCLETLSKMPNNFLDCVITSPPYWQLRDYGYAEQWGLEPTFQEYLDHLWQLMDEIYRVLKDNGTVWVNLGDTYARGSRAKKAINNQTLRSNHEHLIEPNTKPDYEGLDKCLLLIPHRFAIGCIDRGWIVRNDIIWAKRNGMPESVRDRFSKKHEYIFFMVKQEDYYFDLDSIRDSIKSVSIERYKYKFIGQEGGKSNNFKGNKSHLIPKSKYQTLDIEKEHRQGMHQQRGMNLIEKRNNLPTQEEFLKFIKNRIKLKLLIESVDIPKTTIEHWFRSDKNGFAFPSIEHWNMIKHLLDNLDNEFQLMDLKMTNVTYESDDINKNNHLGKNPGSISDFWDIPTKPSSNEHYASYNYELIKKPILSGCPEGGIIYDPFMGTGSTAEASLRANRKFIGSEMSSKYCDIANKRLEPLLKQINLFN